MSEQTQPDASVDREPSQPKETQAPKPAAPKTSSSLKTTPPKPTRGRIVNYVMNDLSTRPAIVTHVYSDEGNGDMVNLTVFGDNALDGRENVPQGTPGFAMIFRATSVAHVDVPENGVLSSNTWHWPARS